ncbi:restriction endonuclease subunit S [Avibacterium avium]|uniref:restriction endonuclease subunit S n=1 Tax=Avibacterium avium TaxID=751 RepID=UPI003BF7FA48
MLPEKRHTKTKPSGVEWLGEIPEGWEVIKIKYIAELNPKKSELEHIDRECSFIPMEKLKLGKVILDETRKIEDVYDGYTYFIDNDLLIAKVTPCFENKNFAIAENLKNGIGFGSSEIYVLRSNEKSLSKFLFYRLQENKFMDLATYSMSGAGGLKRIPSDFLSNYKIALPPLLEQTAIADYLDRKTAHIDRLISKQQTLLDKLAEQRTALITAVVTGKMDTNGKQTGSLKNSGVEWLGEIPEGWEVYKITHLLNESGSGTTPKKDSEIDYYDGNILWITTSELREKDIWYSKQKISEQALEEYSALKIYPINSVVIAMYGATIGRLGILKKEATFNQACCVFVPSEKLNYKFLFYWLQYRKPILISLSNGGGQPNLNQDDLRKIKIPLPPLPEQTAIADYLDRETAKIDRLREKIEQSIDKLKEYRSALITNAVTGKIRTHKEQL